MTDGFGVGAKPVLPTSFYRDPKASIQLRQAYIPNSSLFNDCPILVKIYKSLYPHKGLLIVVVSYTDLIILILNEGGEGWFIVRIVVGTAHIVFVGLTGGFLLHGS